MNIKKMTIEELEKLSHTDIAYNILKYEKKRFTTVDLLKEVCNILKYGNAEYENLIGDFYTSLNLDKRFILIEGKWDLAENHSIKIVIDDDLDEDIDENEDFEEEEEEEETTEDDIVSDDIETMEDVEDEDLEDLTIVEEDEVEEEL